jgi:hypothetical protein
MFTFVDVAWPWVGLVAAAVLTFFLFTTDALRSDLSRPRRRDVQWLAFLAVAVYLVHQFEEYGIAANGVPHAFPDALCAQVGQPPYPGCSIPPDFYLAVNLPLVWLAAPVAAVLAPRSPLVALTLCGVIAVNAMVHIAPSVASGRYEPGLLTAVLLFVPITIGVAAALVTWGQPYGWRAAVPLLAAGALMHAVLGAGVVLFLRGVIPAWLLIVLQPAGIGAGFALVALAAVRLQHGSPGARRDDWDRAPT